MSEQRVGFIRRSWRLFWRFVTSMRRMVVNILFLAIVVLIIGGLMVDDAEPIAQGSVLLLAPSGVIVEQRSLVDPLVRFVDPEILEKETVLHELIEAVEHARTDDRIQALLMDLNTLNGVGFSSARELGSALRRFKDSGKAVIAMADSFDQQRYLLASFADEIYLHKMGMVGIRGFGVYPSYYRDLLTRLKVDVHVFRVGQYKSAVEPYLRDDMSPQAKLNSMRWLQSLWDEYLVLLEANRDLERDDIEAYVNEFDQVLQEVGGDAARAALDHGLIDNVLSREDMVRQLAKRIDGDPDELLVHYYHYLDDVSAGDVISEEDDAVAVVVAQGMIVDGEQPPGVAGGDTIAAQLREAREDEQVKAVVLRIDSQGGSAFASEVIREQVLLLQQAGKPVVASMAGIAASGGYWIAAGADEIWAQPSTITGSIGIFGLFPSFYRSLEHWGIHSDGVGTTRIADSYRSDRPMSDVVAKSTQLLVEEGYRRFITLVAEARGLSVEAVDRIAQGQVWSGASAQEQGLVDQLGGVDQAVAAAAALAELTDYRTRWIADESWLDNSLWQRFLGAMGSVMSDRVKTRLLGSPLLAAAGQPFTAVPMLNDPAGIYVQCMDCIAL